MPVWDHAPLEALTPHTQPAMPAMPASPHQPASPSASAQCSGLAMPIMLSVLVLAASTLALQAAKQTRRPLEEQRTTEARMKRIEGALRAYVILNKQLPCPAKDGLNNSKASVVLGGGVSLGDIHRVKTRPFGELIGF